MKEENLLLSETKSSERLEKLYNDWARHTMFLSTENCEDPSWDSLVEYGKNNREEAIAFGIEYLEEIGSNWCILSFIDEAIGDPIDHEKTTGYIDPNNKDVKNAYLMVLKFFDKNLDIDNNAWSTMCCDSSK